MNRDLLDFASPKCGQTQCLVASCCTWLCVQRLQITEHYLERFHFKLSISVRQLAAFSALRLSSLIPIPFVFISSTIFEMQMKFYVRFFANEDWQTFFFSENKFLFLLLIKITWSPFSEKNNPYYSVVSRINLTQNFLNICNLKLVKEKHFTAVTHKVED